MIRFPPTSCAKGGFYLDGEGLVAVVAVSVSGGLSRLQIRIGRPTGILVLFGMEEFVCEGRRRQPIRADRNSYLM